MAKKIQKKNPHAIHHGSITFLRKKKRTLPLPPQDILLEKQLKDERLNSRLANISISMFSIDASDLAVFEAVKNEDRTIREIRQKINKDFKEVYAPATEKAEKLKEEISALPEKIKVENSEDVAYLEKEVEEMSLKVTELKIKIGEARKEVKKEEIKKLTNPITELDIEL
jgi:hypothetical protein